MALRAWPLKHSYMVLLVVPAPLHPAVRFDVPRPAGIAGQVAILDEPPGVQLRAHGLRPVAVDLAAPDGGMAARADQHARLGMTGDLAIEDLALPLQLRRDAEALAVVNAAAADERVAVLADRHLSQGVAEV